jgi:hypothetical protein
MHSADWRVVRLRVRLCVAFENRGATEEANSSAAVRNDKIRNRERYDYLL